MQGDSEARPSAPKDPGRLVCIRTFRDLPQGELARSRLAAQGLVAHLADEFVVGINWLFSQAVGGVSILVAAADAREAVAALTEDRTEDLLAELGLDEHGIETCPSCGSVELADQSRWIKLAAWLALFFTPGPYLHPVLFWLWVGMGAWVLIRPRWRCRQCGSMFREL